MPTPSNTELPRISTPRLGDDRAQQRADPVQREPDREAALAAPAVGQLAAGDHQDRHDQQEQRDRGLDALDGRVQVVADVADHHVHVRAGEAADELRECERKDQPPRRDPALAGPTALVAAAGMAETFQRPGVARTHPVRVRAAQPNGRASTTTAHAAGTAPRAPAPPRPSARGRSRRPPRAGGSGRSRLY